MPLTTTNVRVRGSLVDEAMKVLGAKSRTAAVRMVLREIVEMRRSNAAMKKSSGKPKR
jgi:Arc/MetJ family transcription regulator